MISNWFFHMKESLTKIHYKFMCTFDSGNFFLILFLYFILSKILREEPIRSPRNQYVFKIDWNVFFFFKLKVSKGTSLFQNIFYKYNCFLSFLNASSPNDICNHRKFLILWIMTRWHFYTKNQKEYSWIQYCFLCSRTLIRETIYFIAFI